MDPFCCCRIAVAAAIFLYGRGERLGFGSRAILGSRGKLPALLSIQDMYNIGVALKPMQLWSHKNLTSCEYPER